MNPLRSVGARLSGALLLVVTLALGTVYLVVVPSLEHRLVDSKVRALRRAAPTLARELERNPNDPNFMDDATAATNARVVLYRPLAATPFTLQVFDDSRQGVNSSDVENDPLALRAATAHRVQQGTVSRGDERYAEVAVPVTPNRWVLLLSASLHDSLATVDLVQRRVLVAGALALLGALVVGYGGARFFARRIRRLEQAAERIARGEFDEPVTDPATDELGELAAAFDTMRRRLARLEDARRAFVANASHELRTPLFSLGGFLELLTDEELDEATRREFLLAMREQVGRLTKLATDLLDLSRLDAGRLRVEAQSFDLGELAEDLLDEFRAVAVAGEHSLDSAVDEHVMAFADDQRVLQIGRILVENALLHTPPGTHVLVGVRSGAGRAQLTVEDDGPGIPEAHAPHVFDRFYRVDGAVASGSGIGLAVARELAQLMRGIVELESQAGHTVFTLDLPLGQPAPAEATLAHL